MINDPLVKTLLTNVVEDESNMKVINMYINALEIYTEGQEKMLEAIDTGDEDLRAKAQKLIDQADREHDRYNNALERRLARTKVDIEYYE